MENQEDKKIDYRKIIRYIFSGGTAAATQIFLTALFTSGLHWWYLISTSVAFIVAVVVSFTLQKYWTFQHKNTSDLHMQVFAYLAIAVSGLIVNAGLMFFFVDICKFHYLLGQIFSGAIIALYNYFLYGKFVFKK